MGLLQRILSVLDLREDDGGDDPVDRGTAARVEREPAGDVTGDEGSDHDSGNPPGNRSQATDADSDGDGDADPGAAGPDAAPSTGSLVDSEEGVESAGTAGSGGRTGDGGGNASPPGAGVVSEEHVDGPVEEVKGIGPAYAGRLEDAGVTTIGQLAVADAESLAAATDVSQKRIARWIERARAR